MDSETELDRMEKILREQEQRDTFLRPRKTSPYPFFRRYMPVPFE